MKNMYSEKYKILMKVTEEYTNKMEKCSIITN